MFPRLLVFFILLGHVTVYAQATTPEPVGLQGYVLNQTVSPRAQIFVQRFEHEWRSHRVSEFVNLQILEKSSARWGAQVSIVLADRVVYRTGISQRTRDWDRMVSSATQRVAAQARMHLQNPAGYEDPDLAPSEF